MNIKKIILKIPYLNLIPQTYTALKFLTETIIELTWTIIAYPFYKNKKEIPYVFKN